MVLANYIQSFENGKVTGYEEPAGRITIVNEPKKSASDDAPAEDGMYIVVSGDCLWKIAAEKLGSGALWKSIYDANRSTISNPGLIYSGQRLIIPSVKHK